MDTVICKEVVITTIRRRGSGKEHSPVRVITEVYEKDGKLIAEYDPCPETFAPTALVLFHNWCLKNNTNPSGVGISDVHKWLDEIKGKHGYK